MTTRQKMALALTLALGASGCVGDGGSTSEESRGRDGQRDVCVIDGGCGDPALECEDGLCKPHGGDRNAVPT